MTSAIDARLKTVSTVSVISFAIHLVLPCKLLSAAEVTPGNQTRYRPADVSILHLPIVLVLSVDL